MVRTSLEKSSAGPPMVGTFRVIIPLNVPTIEAPRRQRGNEKFSCFVIEVEKIFYHLLGAMYPMYPIHRTHVSDTWVRIWDQKFLRWMDTDGSNQPGKKFYGSPDGGNV